MIEYVEDIAKKYAALKATGAPPEALNALHDLLLGVYRRLFSADPFDPEHLAQRVVESILRAAEDDLDESPGIPLPR